MEKRDFLRTMMNCFIKGASLLWEMVFYFFLSFFSSPLIPLIPRVLFDGWISGNDEIQLNTVDRIHIPDWIMLLMLKLRETWFCSAGIINRVRRFVSRSKIPRTVCVCVHDTGADLNNLFMSPVDRLNETH